MALFLIHEKYRLAGEPTVRGRRACTSVVAADSYDEAIAKYTAGRTSHGGAEDSTPPKLVITKFANDCADFEEVNVKHEEFVIMALGERAAERELGYHCPVCNLTHTEGIEHLEAARLARKTRRSNSR